MYLLSPDHFYFQHIIYSGRVFFLGIQSLEHEHKFAVIKTCYNQTDLYTINILYWYISIFYIDNKRVYRIEIVGTIEKIGHLQLKFILRVLLTMTQ